MDEINVEDEEIKTPKGVKWILIIPFTLIIIAGLVLLFLYYSDISKSGDFCIFNSDCIEVNCGSQCFCRNKHHILNSSEADCGSGTIKYHYCGFSALPSPEYIPCKCVLGRCSN